MMRREDCERLASVLSSEDNGNSEASKGKKERRNRGWGSCPRRTEGTVKQERVRREEGTGEDMAAVLEGQREQ
jgi:hypothetical protein